LAPYLVQLNDEVTQWLKKNKAPWGLYLTSKATLKDLRKHLRGYLRVLLPGDPVPVTLRFYDPRNIWNFLSVLDDWQVHSLLGPIISIKTDWQETIIENDYEKIRQQYPVDAYSKQLILKITDEQKHHLDDFSMLAYSESIGLLMQGWYDEYQIQPYEQKQKEQSVTFVYDEALIIEDGDALPRLLNVEQINAFALILIRYLNKHEIKDDRSIRGMAKLKMIKNITSLAQMPNNYLIVIEQENVQGDLKATDIIIDQLGCVPV
jgi:hypothetical protein